MHKRRSMHATALSDAIASATSEIRFRSAGKSLRNSILTASGAALLGTSLMSPAALAQDQEVVDEVVVTGSRIVRRDYDANSPLVTVDAADLESQSGLNIESYLNQMPNFNPAASPVTTEQDIQPTPVNSVGIATVSLRGFGANRGLVLLDGKRPVPSNALMVTDINGIPSAMVERVEIITGGASAVYGADAIGGVTNFILRDDFEGAEFDFQTGVSDAGDGEEVRLSAALGTDFGDGRGNITVALEHYSREEALERNRSFYTDSWTDPNQPADDLFIYASAGYNGAFDFNNPAPSTMDALFPDSPPYTNQEPQGAFFHNYRFGPNGEIWTINGDNLSKYEAIGGEYNETTATWQTYDTTIPGNRVINALKYNDTKALASAPQDRYSFFLSTDYDITESVKFFARANFNESNTKTLLYSTVPIFGWESRVTFDPVTDSPLDPTLDWTDGDLVTAALANPEMYPNPDFIPTGAEGAQHPVPNEVAIMLMSRPDPAGQWVTELFPENSLPRRTTDNTNSYWQIETGLEFDLPIKDWTGEFYYSYGEANAYTLSDGSLSLQRWRELVNAPDWGRGATFQGNQADPDSALGASSANFGTVPVTCDEGLYDTFFAGEQPLSEDCLYIVNAPLQTRTENDQEIVELNFQGGLFELPAGEVRAAIGFSSRSNGARFYPDILQSTRSIRDQVIGLYPTAPLDASTGVEDIYGELLVPILEDTVVQGLELELGFRQSSYDYADDTDTYKVLANVEVNDALRLRGGFNRANRAPNLGELFLNLQEIYVGEGGANFGDACGLRSNATYGARGVLEDPILEDGEVPTEGVYAAGQTPEGAYSTYLICRAQMTDEGAEVFYQQNAGGAAAGFGAAWRYQQGNPNLNSEEADTWSFGFVFAGDGASDNPWISGLTGSVDWWEIEITDAIQQYSPDYAGYRCYGTRIVTNEAEAAEQAATPGCQNVPRSPTTGGALTKLVEFDNQSTIKTAGFDVAINWFANLQDIGIDLPGGIGFSTQASIVDYYKTKQSPSNFDVEIDWAGSLGPDLQGTNPGAYDYRLFSSFNYMLDDISVSLRWRYLPEVISAAQAQQNAVIANNNRIYDLTQAGTLTAEDGIMVNYTPLRSRAIADYSVFDLSMNWQINDVLSLRAGIDNLLDVSPSITGGADELLPEDISSVCDEAAELRGCVDPGGPATWTSGSGITNPGYYDIMGRRFFVGLKASF